MMTERAALKLSATAHDSCEYVHAMRDEGGDVGFALHHAAQDVAKAVAALIEINANASHVAALNDALDMARKGM